MSTNSSWRSRLLTEKVEPFLLATRVGIDFGETKGGIAIERGQRVDGRVVNEIVHAEVFCDFHDTTLEERRGLRRGRRSRHAKKIRLARLRSWVVRQPDPTRLANLDSWLRKPFKLPREKRLPDPYALMRNPQYQCQPFEYDIGRKQLSARGFNKNDESESQLPTWIEAVKAGKRNDAAAFVIALTHIFQKRGYSYSDAELEMLTDSQLEGFLASAALKNSSGSFIEKIEQQIARRENIAEDDKQDWRGKVSERVKPEELRVRLNQARERAPKRRKAVHRREKVQLLRDVIEGFVNAVPTHRAEEKRALIERWQNQLAGAVDQDFDPRRNPHGLLSKTIRAPRFDNRINSGCAWCGRTCARRSKNRRDAFLAAVNNLRVWEIPPQSRGLGPQEQDQVIKLWQQAETNPQEARQRFLGLCRHLGVTGDKQREIAKLFDDWKTHNDEAPKRIRRLRVKLSGKKPRRLLPLEQAKFEQLWTGLFQKSVTEDSDFWKSFGKKVSDCFEELRKAGHPVANEEMKKQLTDLLTVEPKGRHRLCGVCMKKAARGETMFQQGIMPWEIKSRGARNPRREQHQERLLRRVEFLLFKAKRNDGTRLVPDPKHIRYVTLEIPKPENKNAPRKGEQTKTERRTPKAALHAETGGRCIYCNNVIAAVTEVSEEHIFPLAEGGPDVRDLNLICSCRDCNDKKGKHVPWQWRNHIKNSWTGFEQRVRENQIISPRKKDILLLGSQGGNIEALESFKVLGIPLDKLTDAQREQFSLLAGWQPGDPFPSDPTALARAGSMPRQFIVGIREIFKRHGFAEEELPIVTPKGALPLIQKAEGWMTSRLRNSWRYDPDGKENFPAKQREESLVHHAQDAALLAALPPHQWRDQIFIDTEKRVRRDRAGKVITNGDGQPEMDEITVALRDLAPNWLNFESRRQQEATPLVRVLESTRQTLRSNWRTKFINKSYWRVYCPNANCDPEFKRPIRLDDLYRTSSLDCSSCGQRIRDNDSPFVSVRITQHKTRWESLSRCETEDCGSELKDIVRNQQTVGKQCTNPDCNRRYFSSDIPGRRRRNDSSQQQGQVLIIKPLNGPPRVVNTEAIADSICLIANGGKWSVKFRLQPAIARLTGFSFEPRLDSGDRIIKEIRRQDAIFLPEESKVVPLVKGGGGEQRVVCFHAAAWPFLRLPSCELPAEGKFVFPEGHYRIRQLRIASQSAEVWPEALAGGVAGKSRCCPALNKPLLTEAEIKELREQGAVFTTPKQFPKRSSLGVTELKRLYAPHD